MNATPHLRHRARRLAIQALYQWQVTRLDIAEIEQQFRAEGENANADLDYFGELLRGTVAHVDDIDKELTQVIDRPLAEVDQVERAILRLGTYELIHHVDVPYRVVINEAIKLAKVFGAEHGHKYANSVLDKVARKLRATEVAATDRI
jgi:N utilization substance protein B